jgi:prepilin-type N-terminal cleavage/methylation domain-containing protein
MRQSNRPVGLRGFTLLELMVVVAIVGVLAALTLPGISEMTRERRAAGEFAKLRNALVQSRNLARSLRRCVEVEVVADSAEMTAYPMSSCADDGTRIDARKKTFSFESYVSLFAFSTDTGILRFHDLGGTLEAEPVTIAMTSGNRTKTYAILPGIGAIREP